jgi:micrococcal nuclease
VDWGTRIFWSLVAVLLGASLFFAQGAEAQRSLAKAAEATLETGDLVKVIQVVDGDSLVAENEGGAKVGIRILGIKALARTPERDPAARFGRDAVAAVEKLVKEEPVRVLVHSQGKDRHGRTLATLFVGDEDVGLALVKQGLALAYTVYPVPTMQLYLDAQDDAQAAERGLWADAEIATRARQMSREWSRAAK